jgi:hypothetical protein
MWEEGWVKCELTITEWAQQHCRFLTVNSVSQDDAKLFSRSDSHWQPLSFSHLHNNSGNIQLRVQTALQNLQNMILLFVERGLSQQLRSFLRFINYNGKLPPVPHYNTRQLTSTISRTDPALNERLSVILQYDIHIYETAKEYKPIWLL